MKDFKGANVRAFWMRSYGGMVAGTWAVFLNIKAIHGHEGGGSIDAAWPMAKAVVDDFGTLVCVEAFR